MKPLNLQITFHFHFYLVLLKNLQEDTHMVEEIDEETLYSRLDVSDVEDDMEKVIGGSKVLF